MKIARIIQVICACLPLSLMAEVRYVYSENHYLGLTCEQGTAAEANNSLMLSSANENPAFACVPVNADSVARVVAVMANLSNTEGKSYKVTTSSGERKKIENPEWGMVLNYVDGANYDVILLKSGNTMAGDIADERFLTVKYNSVANGRTQVKDEMRVKRGASLDKGYNKITVENIAGGGVQVSAGTNAMRVADTKIAGNKSLGVMAGAGAKVALSHIAIDVRPDLAKKIETSWTAESLHAHLRESADVKEGIYVYQDRDMREDLLKLGGQYKIAVVRSGSGYDVLYLEGAVVNGVKWKPMMRKARLEDTAFEGHYQLCWMDAEFAIMDMEAVADYDGVFLSFSFPLQQTKFRFYKE